MAGTRSTRAHSSGRILPNQREADEDATILGDDLVTSHEYQQQYTDIMKLGLDDKCRKDYRCRIARITKFWRDNCPEYYDIGVKQVSTTDLQDEVKFYYGRYKEDLMYKGLNTKFVLHFLMSTERKENGQIKSVQDVRKYRDSILWGSKTAGELLPRAFFDEMDKYLGGFKKKHAIARKNGEVDEHAADPITEELYGRLLTWSIESSNIMVWFWTISQWNCMARSASIDPLCLHNFKLGASDSIMAKYDDSKSDKNGEFLNEKNIYANEKDWRKCWWTGMAVWAAMDCERLSTSERIFLSKSAKFGTASTKYCEQLFGIVDLHQVEVEMMMRFDRFNPYGLRKGAATHAVSGTTAPPSLPSIARRGDWSMGDVMDVYWHFAKTGDEYLGRVLRGVSPNDPDFDSLPPHWNVPNIYENEHVKKAMHMLYGPILEAYSSEPTKNPLGLLLRCLPCLVYHSREIAAVMVEYPGHAFTKLAILHDEPLLSELRKLVTLDPTPGVMTQATGIPPHVSLARQLKDILQAVSGLLNSFASRSDDLVKAVENAIERKAWESGHVTGERLKQILDEFHVSNTKQMDLLREDYNRVAEQQGQGGKKTADQRTQQENHQTTTINTYYYDGRYNYVPRDFEFPKANLRSGLRFWLLGQSVSVDGTEVVLPFRKLSADKIPTNLRKMFQTQWNPIFKFLENGLDLPTNTAVSEAELDVIYDKCVQFLKSHVAYCFVQSKVDPLTYTLGTWSNKTSRSVISKHGTDSDKAKLKGATGRNKARAHKFTRRNVRQERVLYPHRQAKRAQQRQRQHDNNGGVGTSGGETQQQERQHDNSNDNNDGGDGDGGTSGGETQQQERQHDNSNNNNNNIGGGGTSGGETQQQERQHDNSNNNNNGGGGTSGGEKQQHDEKMQQPTTSKRVLPGNEDSDDMNVPLPDDYDSSSSSSSSSSDKEHRQKKIKTADPRYFRTGKCGVDPCVSPFLPLLNYCCGKECEKFVHRHCAAKKKSRYKLHVGDLGENDEAVYCSDMCKRSGTKKVGKKSTATSTTTSTTETKKSAATTATATNTGATATLKKRRARSRRRTTTTTTTTNNGDAFADLAKALPDDKENEDYKRHIAFLRREFPTADVNGRRKGRCAIVGCGWPQFQLEGNGSFRCRNCGLPVHHLCVDSNSLQDDADERIKYCSSKCKEQASKK